MWCDLKKKKKIESRKYQQGQLGVDDLENSIPNFVV